MPPFQKKVKPEDESAPVNMDAPVTLTLAQIKELLGGQATGLTPEILEGIMSKTAEMSAEAMRRSLRPENPHAPEISAFSYPEGERAKPKPTLPFELLWGGFPVHKESSVVTWWEMEGFATLKPGVYTCSRRDGAPIEVRVEADRGPDNTIERMRVSFPVDRDTRALIPPTYVWCYQMQHADQDHRETFVDAMSTILKIALDDRKAKDRTLAVA